jgi:hypothetical protein
VFDGFHQQAEVKIFRRQIQLVEVAHAEVRLGNVRTDEINGHLALVNAVDIFLREQFGLRDVLKDVSLSAAKFD